MMRRITLLGGLALLLAPGRVLGFWKKKARACLPSGGTVAIPSGYLAVAPGKNHSRTSIAALVAYRNYRSTAAGTNECDGVLVIASAKDYKSIEAFEQEAHVALTNSWSYSSLKPGWFGGKHESYSKTKVEGPSGPELQQQLTVHLVGFWDVYDEPAHLYAVNHQSGLLIAFWIFDSQGGIAKARKLADEIAGSFAA